MFPNKFAFPALAVVCVVAAGAGGYLASRQSATVAPAAAATSGPPATAPASPDVAAGFDRPVQETEAVVGESSPAAAQPSTASRSSSAPAKRSETAASKSSGTAASTPRGTGKSAKAAPPATPRLEHTWPSGAGAASNPPSASTTSSVNDASTSPTPRIDDRSVRQEPPPAPEPPQKSFDELVVSADSVIGLQNETALSSERARVEDRVEARVARDVRVGDRVAIPAGSRVIGSVMQVDRGGKFKERARLGVRFHTVVLADGTRLPISTDTIYRDGEAPGNQSAAKIGGGAVGGTIIGAILGGAKGAAIGGIAGAGAGTAVVASGDRNAATLRAGEPISVRLQSPVTVTTERAER